MQANSEARTGSEANAAPLAHVTTTRSDGVAGSSSPLLGRLIRHILQQEEAARDLQRQEELERLRELARYD